MDVEAKARNHRRAVECRQRCCCANGEIRERPRRDFSIGPSRYGSQEAFNLEIPDEDAEKIGTVGDAIKTSRSMHRKQRSKSLTTLAERATVMKRTVITGIGVISPLGNTVEGFGEYQGGSIRCFTRRQI